MSTGTTSRTSTRPDRARRRPLAPDRPETVALRSACRARKDLVGHRVALANQLRAHLRFFHPGPVGLFAVQSAFLMGAERVIAIHDELDIDFGTLRIKLGGGDNGHNGLKSMRSSLGTGDFFRVRAGIGRPPGRQDVADFVLSNYSGAQRKELPFQVDSAADAVESLIADGLEKTQQTFN